MGRASLCIQTPRQEFFYVDAREEAAGEINQSLHPVYLQAKINVFFLRVSADLTLQTTPTGPEKPWG